MGGYYLMGTEFQFEKMKKFWRWMVVMVAQEGEYLMPVTVYTQNWFKW